MVVVVHTWHKKCNIENYLKKIYLYTYPGRNTCILLHSSFAQKRSIEEMIC